MAQILNPDWTDAAVVGQTLGTRGDINYEEEGSVNLSQGQTTVSVTFLYEKETADYRFIELYVEDPNANPEDIRATVNTRSTTGFTVDLSGAPDTNLSVLRWHVVTPDPLQVSQPATSQPRYVIAGSYEPALGNPPVNGYVLSSTALGVRSWVAPPSGGGGSTLSSQAQTFLDTPTSANLKALLTDELGATGGKAIFSLGTLAIAAGQTLTVNATGTAVLESRTLTEGAGLAGNTYDFSANRTLALGLPSALSVSSANSVSGTTHSHAITASSNPGAATALLKTDSSGFLQLRRLTLTDYLFVNNSVANLYLFDTSTGLQAAGSGVLTPQSGNTFQNTSYTSGLRGWHVSDAGDAEFNNATIRGELRTSVFKVNEIAATAGTFGVFYSATTLYAPCTTPSAAGQSFSFDAKNSDVTASAMLLALGDIIRIKAFVNSGGVIIADVWATVTARTNHSTYTTYTATLNSGSVNATIPAGVAIVDYGPAGTGFITESADGTVGASPNMTMATHSGDPWNGFTTLMRQGNLEGSYGYASDIYGIGMGQYGVSGGSWLTFDTTNGIRIGNNTDTLASWATSGNLVIGRTSPGYSNLYISAASGLLLRNGSTIVLSLDSTNGIKMVSPADGTTRFRLAADGSGTLANGNISWDASGDATIAGWDVNSGYLAKDTGVNATSAGMAPADYPFFAGSTYANRVSAPFRVTPAGLMTATNANITGTITATSGTIGGWTLGATSLTAGSGSTTIGLDSGATNPAFYAGSATPGSAPFRVTNAGALTATNATITGAITASSGSVTGPLTLSGASGYISLGSTPPTSPTSGTGIFLDRTGIYAQNATTPTVSLTANGLTAGAVTMNDNGMTFSTTGGALSSAEIKWEAAATPRGRVYNIYDSGTGQAYTGIYANSNGAGDSQVGLETWRSGANKGALQLASFGTGTMLLAYAPSGVFSGMTIGSINTPAHMLDVYGTGWFSGNLRTDGDFYRDATKVVGARSTGWTAWTGTGSKATKDVATATTADNAAAIKAILDALIAHGLIGA